MALRHPKAQTRMRMNTVEICIRMSMDIRTNILKMQVEANAQIVKKEDLIQIQTGKFAERDMPNYSSRNFEERGFTIGIGG